MSLKNGLGFFLSLWFKIARADGQVCPGGGPQCPGLNFHLSVSHSPTPSQESGSCLSWSSPGFWDLGEDPEACLTGASCSEVSLATSFSPRDPGSCSLPYTEWSLSPDSQLLLVPDGATPGKGRSQASHPQGASGAERVGLHRCPGQELLPGLAGVS